MDNLPKKMKREDLNIDWDTRRITLNKECTEQELYSFFKAFWISDRQAIMFPFPMECTDVNEFNLIHKWKLENREKIKKDT